MSEPIASFDEKTIHGELEGARAQDRQKCPERTSSGRGG